MARFNEKQVPPRTRSQPTAEEGLLTDRAGLILRVEFKAFVK